MEKIDQNLETWKSALACLPAFAREAFESVLDGGAPPPFWDFVIETLEKDAEKGKPGPISSLLIQSSLLVHAVSSPDICPLAQAVQLARATERLGEQIDSKIIEYLTRASRTWPEEVPEAEIVRALEVIDAISDCERLVFSLMKFTKLPQPRLRSKAVKLMARGSRNSGWVGRVFADPDPRARANLIDGVSSQAGNPVTALLQQGAQDPHHRVALTSLLALCRGGDQASCEEIHRLANDGDPNFRRAAKWALGQLQETGPVQEPAPVQETAPVESEAK